MAETAQPILLTVRQAAQRMNCSRPHVYKLIESGQIPAVRLGNESGPLRVPADELEAWLFAPAGDAA